MPNCDRFPEIATGGIGLGGVIGGIVGIIVGATNPIILAAFAVGGIGAITTSIIYVCRNNRERDNLLRDGGIANAEAGVNAAAANVADGLENVNAMQQDQRVLQEQVRLLTQRLEAQEADAADRRAEDNLRVNQGHAAPELHGRVHGRRERGMFLPVPQREAANIEPSNNDALRAGMR